MGFEEDAEYLGGLWKRLVDSTLAVPGAVRFLRDVESFRYATLLFLLRRADLALISVWHPSFLTLLMGALSGFWEELVRDVERGTEIVGRRLRPLPRRAAELRRLAPDALVRIWPRLAHELAPGGVYSVVVTTGGGLYRYRLEDRVEVTGFAGRTPSLRFLGREGHVSDLRGEKLHESFVAGALARAFRRLAIAPRFAMLAPEADSASAPRYVLYLEIAGQVPPGLAAAAEEEMAANPHYRACVALGQLAPAAVFLVEGPAFPRYLQRCRERGQRLGDVKPLALSSDFGWLNVFSGLR